MPEPAQTAVSAPRFALGDRQAAYAQAVERARTEDWATRLFARDATLWTDDPRVAASILDRLGWLDAPAHFTEEIAGLEGFGDAVDDEGFTTAVVAGMGGSSLAPDVLRRTFGTVEGYLGAAHPGFDRSGLRRRDPRRPRPAPDARPRRFEVRDDDRAECVHGLRLGAGRGGSKAVPHHVYEHPGAYFALITDPGKSVDAIKHHDDVREVFLNPPDIGGRYSALTYVGLVPASLIGSTSTPSSRRPRRCSPPAASRTSSRTRASRSGSRSGRWPRPGATSSRSWPMTTSRASGRGSSSSSPRAPASTRSASCRSISNRWAQSSPTVATGRSCGSP